MKSNIRTFVFVLTFSIFGFTAFASNPAGNEDFATMTDPEPAPGDPGAPINDYLIPMLVVGIAIGYRLLRKKTEIVK